MLRRIQNVARGVALPAVVVLARGVGTLNRRSVYGVWHLLALATMVISLLFDYRDGVRYLFVGAPG